MPAYDNTLSSTLGGYPLDCGNLKGMFGWVDFREYEKKKKKKKNWRGGYLVRGRGGKKIGDAQVFSPWAHQNVFSPKLGEN